MSDEKINAKIKKLQGELRALGPERPSSMLGYPPDGFYQRLALRMEIRQLKAKLEHVMDIPVICWRRWQETTARVSSLRHELAVAQRQEVVRRKVWLTTLRSAKRLR